MKTRVATRTCAAIAAVGLMLGAGSARAADKVVVDSAAMRERLEAALDRLEWIEARAKGKDKKALKADTEAARKELEAALEALLVAEKAAEKATAGSASKPASGGALVYRNGTGLVAVPPGGAPAGAHVLKAFGAKKTESLVREIGLRDTLEDKRDLVTRRAEKYYFTSAEAEAIVRAFAFDRDRVKVAAIVWPVVIDPTHFDRVLDTITGLKQRAKLEAMIGWAGH